jgi:High potential iron-sulfur protein
MQDAKIAMAVPHKPKTVPDQASPLRPLSRRAVLPVMIGSLAGAGLLLGGGQAARAQPKTSKKVAKYQDHPNKGQHCKLCRYFQPPHSCQLVAGTINPNGWCSFFAKKT